MECLFNFRKRNLRGERWRSFGKGAAGEVGETVASRTGKRECQEVSGDFVAPNGFSNSFRKKVTGDVQEVLRLSARFSDLVSRRGFPISFLLRDVIFSERGPSRLGVFPDCVAGAPAPPPMFNYFLSVRSGSPGEVSVGLIGNCQREKEGRGGRQNDGGGGAKTAAPAGEATGHRRGAALRGNRITFSVDNLKDFRKFRSKFLKDL